jgi:hypothetical protein
MKTYQAHLPETIHGPFKAALKRSYARLSMSEGFELGAALVLLEAGETVPTSPKVAIALARILAGQAW